MERRAVSIAPLPTHTTLLADLDDTLRKLLQHLILCTLLTTRLFMLPLLYVSVHLSSCENGESTGFSVSFLKHTYRTFHSWVPKVVKQHRLVVRSLDLMDCARREVVRIFRVLLALYQLGVLLERNPDMLKSRTGSRNVRPSDSSTTVTSDSINHATASQVYHAALTNDNMLDDILAGFTDETHTSTAITEHRRPSTVSTMDCQRCSQPRYRNSSIQTTPERMLTPLPLATLPQKESSPQAEQEDLHKEFPILPSATPESLVSVIHTAFDKDTAATAPAKSTAFEDVSGRDETFLRTSVSASPIVEGCPKEMARQLEASPRLARCKSSLSGTARREVENRKSVPVPLPLTPTRRAKLQRRVKTPRT